MVAFRSGGIYDAGTRWRFDWYDQNNERKWGSIPKSLAPTKRDARTIAEAAARQGLLDRLGVTVPADRVTVREWMQDHYLAWAEGAHAGETFRHESGLWAKHGDPRLGTWKLAELSGDRMATLYAELERDGVSDHRRHALDRLLTQAIHLAAERGMLGPEVQAAKVRGDWTKPWKGVPQPPAADERPRLETADALARVIAAANDVGGLSVAAAVMLAVVCAHRPKEQIALRWGHEVTRDPNDPAVWLVKSESDKGGKRRLRTHRVEGDAARLLDEWERDCRGRHGAACAWVFPRERPSRAYAKNRRRVDVTVYAAGDQRTKPVVSPAQWAKIRKAAGLAEDFRKYDLRGSSGTFLETAADLGVGAIGQHLGHAPGSPVTARHYLRRQGAAVARDAGAAFGRVRLSFLGGDVLEEARRQLAEERARELETEEGLEP